VSKDYLVSFLSDDAGGVQYANTICVHDDEFGGPRSPSEFLDEVESWLKTKYVNILASDKTLRVIRAFQIPTVYGDDTEVDAKTFAVTGGLAAGDGKVPREATLTLTLRSSHTSRRKMGRLSIPSPRTSNAVDASGNWSTSNDYWTLTGTFADALLAGHDVGVGGVDGHLSTRIYSRRQHQLGTGDKTTDVDVYIRRPRPRWLRRRVSAP